ncbi:hypothetical protein K1719_027100 [Acacia pycnantha]|nr:hypothetical protein K1719_036016 [Acacia pycnantha]KAI9093651.1 hypothetical protein K1719_027100 [Acacia pycnantha]
MADDNSASSTSTSTEEQTLTPPPDDDPPAPASVRDSKIDKEDPDLSRDCKRRKMCPTALDKIEDFVPPNRTFSFTFDTKFSACGSDATPKFGSFQSMKKEVFDSDNFMVDEQVGGHILHCIMHSPRAPLFSSS